MDAIKTINFDDGFSLEIIQDDDPQSPREDDNLGTMVCFSRRHNLGDKHDYREDDYSGWEQVEAAIVADNPDCVILPLFLFDHSGMTISTTSEHFRAADGAGWDWGQVGFIFISRKKINDEFGAHGGRTDEQIEQYLRNEVETYDQYQRGDIYGFILRKPNCETCDGPGEQEDSCWGFYGGDPAENGMSDHLDTKYHKQLQEA